MFNFSVHKFLLVLLILVAVTSCASPSRMLSSNKNANKHKPVFEDLILESDSLNHEIQNPVAPVSYKTPVPKPDEYSVEAHQISLKELLLVLSQKAGLSLEISEVPGNKKVSFQVVDKRLEKILGSLAESYGFRYIYDPNKKHLSIKEDLPYQEIYSLEYLNLIRKHQGQISVAMELGSGKEDKTGLNGQNQSNAMIENISQSDLWGEIENSLAKMIGKENVICHSQAGVMIIQAKQQQHQLIQTYLNTLEKSLHRQVLIEATIVEVNLNNAFNAGVDWQRLAQKGAWNIQQKLIQPTLNAAANAFSIAYQSQNGNFNNSLKLLEEFGDVKVLSRPKMMALNNQSSLLKVVDNKVYFTLDVSTSTASGGATESRVQTTINTVPVGFTMSVTPYVSQNHEVLLNIRPSISRILRFVNDPSPALSESNIISTIPEIQVREMEAMLRMKHGQVAVLGGMMQDSIEDSDKQIPWLGNIPFIGNLFKAKSQSRKKSELVIFIRPWIENHSVKKIQKSLKSYQGYFAE